MKRTMLYDQYRYLNEVDFETLNVGAGTIDVLDDKDVVVKHKLSRATVALIKYAYERGLKHLPIY